MRNGVPRQSPPQTFLPVSFLLFAVVVLSGTCELDPPTKPPADWEFFCEGKLEITDGPNGRMTQVYLTFSSIALPPANFSYATYLATGADSIPIGTLQPNPASGRAALAWNDASNAPIFGRYSQLRINLQAKGSVSASQSLVRLWWDSQTTEPGLISLFGNAGLTFQMLEQAQKLEDASVPIATASSVADAKEKISALAKQETVWRGKLASVGATCNDLATSDTALASALPTFQTAYRCVIAEADSLSSSCAALLQSPEDSLAYYRSAGGNLKTQAIAIKGLTEILYYACRFFAVLKIETIKTD